MLVLSHLAGSQLSDNLELGFSVILHDVGLYIVESDTYLWVWLCKE
jgi:hypothetical protein